MSEESSPPDVPVYPDISYKPPVLYAAFLIFGLLLNWMWPLEILNFWAQLAIGLLITGMGGGAIWWAVRTLRAAGTDFRLNKPVTAFVRHGPYRFSRNPIYAGLGFVYFGLCILLDAPIAALLLVPLTMVMNRTVIAAEEDFLERKFGADYRRYRDVVSRWM